MHLKSILAAAAFGVVTIAAQAHSKLQASTPAEGSKLAASPTSLVLQFSEATQVTALTLQKDSAAEQKLGPLPRDASAKITVPLTTLAPGTYVVSWRAVGDDNHVTKGEIHFSVAGARADAHAADHHQ